MRTLAPVFLLAACTPSPPAQPPVVVEPAPVATASAPAARDAGRVEEIPPPPASASSAPPAIRPACLEPCKGTTNTDLESALALRAKQAHRCYDNALAQDATLQGKVMLEVRIGADGTVCSASGKAQGGMLPVGACVASYFRTSTFPPPQGGCVDVTAPIMFVPKP